MVVSEIVKYPVSGNIGESITKIAPFTPDHTAHVSLPQVLYMEREFTVSGLVFLA